MACVLLIDDDDFTRRTIGRTLERQGHSVVAVTSGREALARLSDGQFQPDLAQPDLVLTDIMMPDMDGLELIPRLRKARPGLKIIAMSAGSQLLQSNFLREARLLGAHETLQKPCSGADLTAAIGRVLAAEPHS